MALDIKKELFKPTMRRLQKICAISISTEIIGGVILSTVGYLALGDRFTPSLLFLRRNIPDH